MSVPPFMSHAHRLLLCFDDAPRLGSAREDHEITTALTTWSYALTVKYLDPKELGPHKTHAAPRSKRTWSSQQQIDWQAVALFTNKWGQEGRRDHVWAASWSVVSMHHAYFAGMRGARAKHFLKSSIGSCVCVGGVFLGLGVHVGVSKGF